MALVVVQGVIVTSHALAIIQGRVDDTFLEVFEDEYIHEKVCLWACPLPLPPFFIPVGFPGYRISL